MAAAKKASTASLTFRQANAAHINKNRRATEKYPLLLDKRERRCEYLIPIQGCTHTHTSCTPSVCVCAGGLNFFSQYAFSSEKFNYARPHKSYSAARAVGAVHLKTQIIRRQRESEFWCPVSEWARSPLTTSSISRFSIGLAERQLSQCDTYTQFSALHGRLNKYYLCGIGQEGTMESFPRAHSAGWLFAAGNLHGGAQPVVSCWCVRREFLQPLLFSLFAL